MIFLFHFHPDRHEPGAHDGAPQPGDIHEKPLEALQPQLQLQRQRHPSVCVLRIAQVAEWLRKGVRPAEMTNLPKDLRDRLSAIPFGGAKIFQKRVSAKDGTVTGVFAKAGDDAGYIQRWCPRAVLMALVIIIPSRL